MIDEPLPAEPAEPDEPVIALAVAPPDVIQLPQLTLRRWRMDWADDLHAAVEESLPELRPFMPWATDEYDLEQTREFIARSVAGWDRKENFNYAVLTREGEDDAGSEIIGSAGLMTRMGEGVLEIGYWIHTAHTRRGHATATASALAEAALALPGIDRAAIKHDAANRASGRVAEKAGFVHVGAIATDHTEPTAPGQTGVDWVWERRG